MGRKPENNPEELYEAWIACGRSQTRAAEMLGIPLTTMNYYHRERRFAERYAAEFSGAAWIEHKMATISLLNDWPKLTAAIKSIVMDEDEKATNRIAAFRELRQALPADPVVSDEKNMSFIDAKSVTVLPDSSPELTTEQQVRELLESNIINAQEIRTGTKK